jgi:hypothetical protein
MSDQPLSVRQPSAESSESAFARFDPKTGKIQSHGFMHRDHIEAERASGVAIVTHDHPTLSLQHHFVHLQSKKVVDRRSGDPK